MKNIFIKLSGLTFLLSVFLLSCEFPVNLGPMLDLKGPVLEITAPAARKAVQEEFIIEGSISDDSPIRKIEITAVKEGVDFEKQWRYNGDGTWSISEDFGKIWAAYNAAGIEWKGNANSADWVLPVDLRVNGVKPEDGEYIFKFQAWDDVSNSDDNSLRSRILIFDSEPPLVVISSPSIHEGKGAINFVDPENPEDEFSLKNLHAIPNDGSQKNDAAYIGQFYTQGFLMRWQIEDRFDVRSIDIRYYDYKDADIDGYAQTPLPENYIYRYWKNIPPPPDVNDPKVSHNGFINVPDLAGESFTGTEDQLKNPVNQKTTIVVVAVCVDAAGNVIQEKILGYFIYWPLADNPWIEYTDGMDSLDHYSNIYTGPDDPESFMEFLKQETFMIYPGRTIRINSFHPHGIKEMVYSLYSYNAEAKTAGELYPGDYDNVIKQNAPRPNGGYSSVFAVDFKPPSRSGFYIVKAEATSVNNKKSGVYEAIFRVQDISFPDFVQPILPLASQPLYMHIKDSAITISGTVRDATEVINLDLVWINPQSTGYAAMSQLSYFRDQDFEGWTKAAQSAGNKTSLELGLQSTPDKNGAFVEEDKFETAGGVPPGHTNPNKIWRLALLPAGEDTETLRKKFDFSITIPLDHLNIGVDKQPLISQMFLLKAENPDRRTSIVTYAPQGDTSPPVINIENLIINGNEEDIYKPRAFGVLPQFANGNTIQINGTWREDSAEYLDIADFFTPNFSVEINGHTLTDITVSEDIIKTFTDGNISTNINWYANVTVGNDNGQIPVSILRDTLVVNSRVSDIGGNKAESGVSWLIQSDHLRLMRISSEDQDGIYNTGKEMHVFLEFSKPVQLSTTAAGLPVLRLNSRGTAPGTFATAVYDDAKNTSLSTRQYFKYTVAAGDDTSKFNAAGQLEFLDVTGLDTSIAWTAANYPFTWFRGTGETREEIRVTNIAEYNNDNVDKELLASEVSGQVYARRLPLTTINSDGVQGIDFMYTFIAGKRIKIDTAPPTVSSITARTPAGHYTTGAEISVEVEFNKPVRIGSALPRLRLAVVNGGNDSVLTSSVNSDVRVSGNRITFVYRVTTGDTTAGNPILVTGFTGRIEDLAGTALASNGISGIAAADRTLTGRFIDTLTPDVPVVRILAGNVTANNTNAITNVVNGVIHTGNSTSANKTLSNVYRPELWLAIEALGGAHKRQRIEYSVTNDTENYITFVNSSKAININNTPVTLTQGSYSIIARQVDMAGNISAWTAPVSFTLNPGDLVTRIDSSTANGTYTNNGGSRQDTVNITVHFRENITTSGTPTITLNTTPSRNVTSANITNQNSISFSYTVAANENTPLGQNLDVTAITIAARDQSLVQVNAFINVPSNPNRLRDRKSILVQTGELKRINLDGSANDSATYTAVPAAAAAIESNDAWTGYFDLRFARPISKGSGNITITQSTTNYRLPAVLTEAQVSKYRSAVNFDTFYKRGVNGFSGTAPDTSTKFVLDYAQSAVVTPNVSGTDIQRMAHGFHQAEIVSVPMSSQDIEITGDNKDTLRIRLSGSNSLAVLGAAYTISIPANAVQDALSYTWPSSAQNYTYTASGINKPFIRIDKKVNEDRIAASAGGAISPQLNGDFSRILQTTVRLDCRTPLSNVRYNAGWYEHYASAASVTANGHGAAATVSADGTTATGGAGSNWRSNAAADNAIIGFAEAANSAVNLRQPTMNADTDSTAAEGSNATSGTSGTIFYNNFSGTGIADTGPHIQIGSNVHQGYTWRIAARSRGVIDGTTRNSIISEEVAFRTVLTYELTGVTASDSGRVPGDGNTLWIRGGDALSTSSVPGFPLTWDDDYQALRASGARAGVRAMEKYSGNSSVGTTSIPVVWRWTTWEINVRTFHDVILGLNFVDPVNGTPSASDALEGWQYGPRVWSYQRGGWTASKSIYTLYPGRHRWVQINSSNAYSPGNVTNFTIVQNYRPAGVHLPVSPGLTMPPPP